MRGRGGGERGGREKGEGPGTKEDSKGPVEVKMGVWRKV